MICSNEDRRHLLIPNYPELSLRKQCELLGINRSSYYYEQKPIDEEMLFLMRLVDEIYTAHPYFGSRQMVNYLRLKGLNLGRTRIRTIYEKLGLQAVCPGPHTSKPHPEHKVYPYLLRNVEIIRCNHVWSTDITYVRMK